MMTLRAPVGANNALLENNEEIFFVCIIKTILFDIMFVFSKHQQKLFAFPPFFLKL